MTLFNKECKKVFFSIPYLIFVAVLFLFAASQELFDLPRIEEPQPGLASYGTHAEEIPEIIMPAALQSLLQEYSSNS